MNDGHLVKITEFFVFTYQGPLYTQETAESGLMKAIE